jgi:hypothetical protein
VESYLQSHRFMSFLTYCLHLALHLCNLSHPVFFPSMSTFFSVSVCPPIWDDHRYPLQLVRHEIDQDRTGTYKQKYRGKGEGGKVSNYISKSLWKSHSITGVCVSQEWLLVPTTPKLVWPAAACSNCGWRGSLCEPMGPWLPSRLPGMNQFMHEICSNLMPFHWWSWSQCCLYCSFLDDSSKSDISSHLSWHRTLVCSKKGFQMCLWWLSQPLLHWVSKKMWSEHSSSPGALFSDRPSTGQI